MDLRYGFLLVGWMHLPLRLRKRSQTYAGRIDQCVTHTREKADEDAHIADGGFAGVGLELELDEVDYCHFGGVVGWRIER